MGPLNKGYRETMGEKGLQYEITLISNVTPLSGGEKKHFIQLWSRKPHPSCLLPHAQHSEQLETACSL